MSSEKNTLARKNLESALVDAHDFDSFGRAIYQMAVLEAMEKINNGADFTSGPVELDIRLKVEVKTDSQEYVGSSGTWVIVIGSDGTARTVFRPT